MLNDREQPTARRNHPNTEHRKLNDRERFHTNTTIILFNSERVEVFKQFVSITMDKHMVVRFVKNIITELAELGVRFV